MSRKTVEQISVHVSYEIIRLFSEGLYQSPHKAVEELVSNSYDAGASAAHILLPDAEGDQPSGSLWVIDDGHGMDTAGFRQLWRVADSNKASQPPNPDAREPIGQFGIGKLAAYVLAWRLKHISKVRGVIRYAEMNFREVTNRHQAEDSDPVQIELYEMDEETAQQELSEIKTRAPEAWNLLFGPESSPTWTAASLSDFRDLYDKLSAGRLAWVLRTGLPLHSEFKMWLNGKELESAKEGKDTILDFELGDPTDAAADQSGVTRLTPGITIDGIDGNITGRARIFKDRLTAGKAEQYGRSHGFFIRVRGRVINLDDELFGLPALNHAAWSRFALELNADGLRSHLLSSREGVRDSEAVRVLRRYLYSVFNSCRSAYAEQLEKELAGLDIQQLLSDGPSILVTEPLYAGVRQVLATGQESFYVASPALEKGTDPEQWLESYDKGLGQGPFLEVRYERSGEYDRAIRYRPEIKTLIVNTQHPFIEKLLEAGGKSRGAVTLFGSSEVMMDVLLLDHGIAHAEVVEILKDRDRLLRLLAGDQQPTAGEVLRRLRTANTNKDALERAVGLAFRVLGFEYERRGGYNSGPDGVLYARLGRGSDSLDDYKVVYDAKQTNQPAVPADKINISSLNDFREEEKAQFAFFVAEAYQAQGDPEGKLNKLVLDEARRGNPATMLRLDDLRRIVELHYKYGVTLTQLRDLFQTARTVGEVRQWVDNLAADLTTSDPPVPLELLLAGLEDAKSDEKARPNVNSVRVLYSELRRYTPEKLLSALRALETIVGRRWIEVEKETMDVRLHSSANQILRKAEHNLRDLFGKGKGAL